MDYLLDGTIESRVSRGPCRIQCTETSCPCVSPESIELNVHTCERPCNDRDQLLGSSSVHLVSFLMPYFLDRVHVRRLNGEQEDKGRCVLAKSARHTLEAAMHTRVSERTNEGARLCERARTRAHLTSPATHTIKHTRGGDA